MIDRDNIKPKDLLTAKVPSFSKEAIESLKQDRVLIHPDGTEEVLPNLWRKINERKSNTL